jgi:hypothetical protein
MLIPSTYSGVFCLQTCVCPACQALNKYADMDPEFQDIEGAIAGVRNHLTSC